jgi:hypothetical protein
MHPQKRCIRDLTTCNGIESYYAGKNKDKKFRNDVSMLFTFRIKKILQNSNECRCLAMVFDGYINSQFRLWQGG